ncbi:DUF397 domain-containing protein [Streptomyces sp. NPDC001927]
MDRHDLGPATWIKNCHSRDKGGNCLVPVRDSKTPEGPALVHGSRAWDSLVRSL